MSLHASLLTIGDWVVAPIGDGEELAAMVADIDGQLVTLVARRPHGDEEAVFCAHYLRFARPDEVPK